MSAAPQSSGPDDVVISYSHVNAAQRDWMLRFLTLCGVTAWCDTEIRYGENWRLRISKKIEECKRVLLLWTTDTQKSTECVEEMSMAKEHEKIVIPVHFEQGKYDANFVAFLPCRHKVLYFEGNADAHNDNLVHYLREAGIACKQPADWSALGPPPVIRQRPAHADVAVPPVPAPPPAPAVTVPEPVAERRVEFDATEVLGLATETLSPEQRSFFLIKPGNPAATAICEALLHARWDEASGLARQGVQTAPSLESLRLAAVANLAFAAAAPTSIAAPAQAAMCLIVLAGSPESRGVQKAVETALSALERLAGRQDAGQRDEDWTGGLCIGDFIEAERESARILADAGGVPVEYAGGRVRLAFGYMFARHFGARLRLERLALQTTGERHRIFFSPLFACHFLQRRNRHDEILAHPPAWITPHHELFAQLARIVIGSATLVLERDLRADASAPQGKTCARALSRLEEYRAQLDDAARAHLRRILDRYAGEAERGGLSELSAQHAAAVYERLAGLTGGVAAKDRDHLLAALQRQAARRAVADRDLGAVLRCLEEAGRHGHVHDEEELGWLFTAWVARFMNNDGKALERLRELVERLRQEHPQSATRARAEREFREALAINEAGSALQLGESETRYRQQPTEHNKVQLLLALEMEAERTMAAGGAAAVLALHEAMTRRLPELGPALQGLPTSWAAHWMDRFPETELIRLLTPRAAAADTEADPATVAAEPASSLEDAATRYRAVPNAHNTIALLTAARLAVENRMLTAGPLAAADLAAELIGRFGDVPGLRELPADLAREWVGRFPPEVLMKFCRDASAGLSPIHVRVAEPATAATAHALHREISTSEAEDVRKRLGRYRQESPKEDGS